MEEKLLSEGKCLYCDQLLTKKGIGNHLAKHLAWEEKTEPVENTQIYWHIKVEADEMFLHLLVNGEASMKIIDKFLRAIWLDCCDHLSGFGHKDFKIRMNHKVHDVFEPGVKIFHDYDYGTTTRVFLKGVKHYQLNIEDKIILLSRNEPLKLMCANCKVEPAIRICTTCNWEQYSFFCKKCSKKHEKVCEDFNEDSSLPVVNSPRMGRCGYTGGFIDKERDGVYQKL